MKTILILGGTGNRGRTLCRKLLTEGYQVTCVDDESIGWVVEIADCLDNENFKFIRSKVEDIELDDFKEKLDLIYDYTPSSVSPEGKNLIKQLAHWHGCRIITKMEKENLNARGGR